MRVLRVVSPEVSGPHGPGSQAEANAKVPRPKSDIKLLTPFRRKDR